MTDPDGMRFRSLDHVGVVVSDIERSTAWWSTLLGVQPFSSGLRRASEIEDFLGRIVGYHDCDMSIAFWTLPGGTVLEMVQYHNPPPSRVDMETYNAGNTHLCLETPDIEADYARMRGLAEFRSAEPITSPAGPYRGCRICYLRDPDGISIELIQFPPSGRPSGA